MTYRIQEGGGLSSRRGNWSSHLIDVAQAFWRDLAGPDQLRVSHQVHKGVVKH